MPMAPASSLPVHPSTNLPSGPANHSYSSSPYKPALSTTHQVPSSSYNNNTSNSNNSNNNNNSNQNGPVNSGPGSVGLPTQPTPHQLLQQQQQQIMSAVVDVTKLSWAPEIELEVQRYREESKKLRQDEDRLMEARRKSRFELERASWDVERQDHLVGLVLGQLEELDREVEVTDHSSGDHTESSTSLTLSTTKFTGHHHHHHERHHRSSASGDLSVTTTVTSSSTVSSVVTRSPSRASGSPLNAQEMNVVRTTTTTTSTSTPQ
ncbi:hypothetical protein BG015_001404 [Linnemannia schmuckeri]|uniref:Uncharacterized protein n=1 Tax=Linnemannia schmuckeri TaxID=64567 RepID=A0A9P5RQ23_9FUNG|nr:hypothetical protein BG015_001404 [Linnemannia schmuckeri]